MRYPRIAALAAAGVSATALAVAAPPVAADGPQSSDMVVDPTSGPVGTTISVSGEDCVGLETEVTAFLIDWDVYVNDPAAGRIAEGTDIPGEYTEWSIDLVVPADANPEHEHVVAAVCYDIAASEYTATYGPVDFDVTGTAPTTPTTPTTAPSTTTTAPPATTPTTAPTSPPQAQPATPIVRQPNFTG